jgi:uncharacterized membrane protein YfcA
MRIRTFSGLPSGSSSPFTPATCCFGRRWRVVAGQPAAGLTALIGFGGGLIGGLTAMPGAIPAIWCDMRGMPKSDQRGLVQPFIAIMQVLALALLLERQSLSPKLVIDLAISLPALFAGSMLGIVAFRNIDEVGFRKTILVLVLISGASLALA